MTREELNAVRGYVANIQAIKDAHNTEQLPINYGTICTITANGWKLIEELKALEQEPCEDCISREDILNHQYTIDESEALGISTRNVVNVDDILNAKPVQPKSKTGHWIIIDDCELFMAKCSECGEIVDSRMISKYPYCHCGAKMVDSQESEG